MFLYLVSKSDVSHCTVTGGGSLADLSDKIMSHNKENPIRFETLNPILLLFIAHPFIPLDVFM